MEPSSSGRPARSPPKQRSSAKFPQNERVRCPCRDDGGGEIVRFFARLDLGTAFATLIRQRHPMPSCGGLAPTAERTMDPARMIAESLTSDPGIREQNRPATAIVPSLTLVPSSIHLRGFPRRIGQYRCARNKEGCLIIADCHCLLASPWSSGPVLR